MHPAIDEPTKGRENKRERRHAHCHCIEEQEDAR